MKKLGLILISIGVLSGCAAGIDTSKPVAKNSDINKICIDEHKTNLNYTSKEMVEFIRTSLKNKNIDSMTYQENKAQCQYLLKYNFKGKKELITRGLLTLTDLTTSNRLGEVSYKYRGEERKIAKQVGFKGQIDKIVNELFKNYE